MQQHHNRSGEPAGADPHAVRIERDQDGVHEIYRNWRRVLNSYNPVDADGYSGDNDRILCAEAWVEP